MTAVGDTVNIAARFASVAERGEIVIGIGSPVEARVFRAGA